ncbi:glycerophosphodiester phosphodiesterase family protein [Aminobacter sp. NyZ550]|uniref:glycerophosphodiester phosphodiesterase n=1 Tax=Aminobacter sp. NyZ550 TaxID=2979870 RepID=UPI0021D5CE75|nr:glycerophosphodiester phosphodiesterase family protein [Aminobacter sp. NyZ550]WAX96639.1 glycerophosphodiester phosphodiesterase family protein [Aminobacter sp. NyZ550]
MTLIRLLAIAALMLMPTSSAMAEGKIKLFAWGQNVTYKDERPVGNSVEAINYAYELGYDGIELDTLILDDGTPVLSHDDSVKLVDGTKRKITDLPAKEVTATVIGAWRGHDVRVPTLADALAANGDKGMALLDTRVHQSHLAEMQKAIGRSGISEDLLSFSVYDIEQGKAYKAAYPRSPVILKKYDFAANIPFETLDEIASSGLDGIMIQSPLSDEPVDEFVAAAHARKLTVTFFVHGSWPRPDPDPAQSLRNLMNAGADAALTVRSDFLDQN